MLLDSGSRTEFLNARRAQRISFQLPVRCRRGVTRATIMLKDLTQEGARIEGLSGLSFDESITLYLPGLQPKEAYISWSQGLSAGVEFDSPLPAEIFFRLVEDFALGSA